MNQSVGHHQSPPKIFDLFAGCGGLSLGACRAGFDLVTSVELDDFANSTHALNFPNVTHINKDISTLSGKELLSASNLEVGMLDGIIGGPPCQGFSVRGKQDVKDPRNSLFNHFFRLVKECQPNFFVAENVPGILQEQYSKIREAALSQVSNDYILLKPFKVNASEFGAPTARNRVFFVGYKSSAFKVPLQEEHFIPPKSRVRIYVKDALFGLPEKIDPECQAFEQSWKKVSTPNNNYFFSRIKSRIPFGVGHSLAVDRYKLNSEASGFMGTLHSDKVIERFSGLGPGEKDETSRAVRLDPNKFCPTLTAGTAKDQGSYMAIRPIHPTEPRVITAREAARLQGFPDWFQFHSTKWHSFRLIGNSVSPIVAESLLASIFKNMVNT